NIWKPDLDTSTIVAVNSVKVAALRIVISAVPVAWIRGSVRRSQSFSCKPAANTNWDIPCYPLSCHVRLWKEPAQRTPDRWLEKGAGGNTNRPGTSSATSEAKASTP